MSDVNATTHKVSIGGKAKLGRREISKMEKVASIKTAARALFQEFGFEATTTQAIAERAGIGNGTIFSYASTKEDLLIMVFVDDLMDAATNAHRRALRYTDLEKRIYNLYLGHFNFHSKNIDLSRHLVRELAYIKNIEMRPNVFRMVHFVQNTARHFIEHEQSIGNFSSNVDSKMVADNCFSIYYNVLNALLAERIGRKEALALLWDRLGIQLHPYMTVHLSP